MSQLFHCLDDKQSNNFCYAGHPLKESLPSSELERRILPALQSQLMKPEYYALFKSEYEKALKQLPNKQASEREVISKKLNAGQKSIDNLVDALMEAKGSAAIAKRLHELEA
ncbi:hypothetical protein WNY59_16635, partial [Ahrensia kielensis]